MALGSNNQIFIEIYGACYQVERSLDASLQDSWTKLQRFFEKEASLDLLRRIYRDWQLYVEQSQVTPGVLRGFMSARSLQTLKIVEQALERGISLLESKEKPPEGKIVEARIALTEQRSFLEKKARKVFSSDLPPVAHFNQPSSIDFKSLEDLINLCRTGQNV